MGLFDETTEETTFFQEDRDNEHQVTKEIVEEEKQKGKVEPDAEEEVEQEVEEESTEENTEEELEDTKEDHRVPLQELLKERKWRQDIGQQLEAERKRFEVANERLQRLYEAMDQRAQQQNRPHEQPRQQEETVQLPDRSKDPLGYLMAKMEQMERATTQREQERVRIEEENRRQQEEYNRQQQNVQRFQENLMNAEEQFRQVSPDYDEAFDYLTKSRDAELSMLGYNPQQRQQIILQEATQTAANLMSQGINPAERFYQFARQRGFGAQQKQPAPQQPKRTKVEQLNETERKTRSPGRGKATNVGMPTIEALGDMDDSEFDAMFNKLWGGT